MALAPERDQGGGEASGQGPINNKNKEKQRTKVKKIKEQLIKTNENKENIYIKNKTKKHRKHQNNL